MEDLRKELARHDLFGRWRTLEDRWDALFPGCDALFVDNGVEDEDVKKLKTAATLNWLLKFETLNSAAVIGRKTLLLFLPAERLELYQSFAAEAKNQKKEIVLLERNEKALDGHLNVKALCDALKKQKWKSFGVFQTDKLKGRLVELTREFLAKENAKLVDCSKQIQELLSKKDSTDIELIEKASEVTCYFFKKLISNVEDILDKDQKVTHVKISKTLDDLLVASRKKIAHEFQITPSFYDFAYAPIIQSGGNYSLKPDVENRDEPLSQDCILLNLGGKYFELNCNIYRTLLVDPTEVDKKNYNVLYAIHKNVISKLTPGRKLSEVYNEVVQYVTSEHSDYKDKLPNNFGFGIGYEFRESCLAIKADNEKEVIAGQVYTVITSLKDLEGFKGKKYVMHLSDTVAIKQSKPAVFTDGISKKIEDIGYQFEDEKDAKPANNDKKKASTEDFEKEKKPRTRAEKHGLMLADHEKLQKMRDHQKQLLEAIQKELENRLESGRFNFDVSESKKKDVEKVQTYTAETFPKGLNPRQIHVDTKHSAVLLPINGTLVPFHILFIKNVVKHQEGKICGLRFNFQIPGINPDLAFPSASKFGSDPIYIKELSFKSTNIESMNQINKQIQELRKKFKQGNFASSEAKDEKISLRNKLKVLNDLKMRPTLTGKKTIGSLTAYSNGFKFLSKRNETFELPLSNIKHAIFQPCDDNMIIIIHFSLYNPMAINRKPTSSIQFFTEVGYTAEDLNDPRRRNNAPDFEELQEEELEEKAREHYNNLFLDFVNAVEKGWESDLKFDSPFNELGFYGSCNYNNVFIMPTAHCLVSLIETPFLVIFLDDIELVALERMDNKIKNFDLTIIFKDYSRAVQTISNIPKTHLEMLKKWLDEQNILFLEGGMLNLKWDNILKHIRKEPEKFVKEEGGWAAYFDDLDEEEDEEDQSFKEEEEDDSAYNEDEEDDDEFSESELYDEDDEMDSLEEEEDPEEEEEEPEEDDDDSRKKKKKAVKQRK